MTEHEIKSKVVLIEIHPMNSCIAVELPLHANPRNVDFQRIAEIAIDDFFKTEREILIEDVKGQIKHALMEEEKFQNMK